jgi:hypothetical protein
MMRGFAFLTIEVSSAHVGVELEPTSTSPYHVLSFFGVLCVGYQGSNLKGRVIFLIEGLTLLQPL